MPLAFIRKVVEISELRMCINISVVLCSMVYNFAYELTIIICDRLWEKVPLGSKISN